VEGGALATRHVHPGTQVEHFFFPLKCQYIDPFEDGLSQTRNASCGLPRARPFLIFTDALPTGSATEAFWIFFTGGILDFYFLYLNNVFFLDFLKVVQRWHFGMLNDYERNDAYYKALRNQVFFFLFFNFFIYTSATTLFFVLLILSFIPAQQRLLQGLEKSFIFSPFVALFIYTSATTPIQKRNL
jgi:hypothetical protein